MFLWLHIVEQSISCQHVVDSSHYLVHQRYTNLSSTLAINFSVIELPVSFDSFKVLHRLEKEIKSQSLGMLVYSPNRCCLVGRGHTWNTSQVRTQLFRIRKTTNIPNLRHKAIGINTLMPLILVRISISLEKMCPFLRISSLISSAFFRGETFARIKEQRESSSSGLGRDGYDFFTVFGVKGRL